MLNGIRICLPADILTIGENCPPEILEDITNYFSNFLAPHTTGEVKDEVCPNCGKYSRGVRAALMGGGFEWGLVHGEAHCVACGYPARGHHNILDRNGESILTLRNFFIFYAPENHNG